MTHCWTCKSQFPLNHHYHIVEVKNLRCRQGLLTHWILRCCNCQRTIIKPKNFQACFSHVVWEYEEREAIKERV